MIEISEAALVADFRLRTVGLEEGMRSPSASVSICVTCTDLMAKGDEPNVRTQPLNHLVYELVKELVTGDPSFTFLSWLQLRKARGLPTPSLNEPRVLKAWNELRKATAMPLTVERPDALALPEKRLREVG